MKNTGALLVFFGWAMMLGREVSWRLAPDIVCLVGLALYLVSLRTQKAP